MKKFSFTKANRILKRTEYIALSRKGKKIHTHYFLAVYQTGTTHQNRLGITVTKKVGNAVTRNQIKRYVREFFRLNQQCLEGVWDINVIAKKQAAGTPSEKVYPDLRKLFKTINFRERTQLKNS
ncbi:ribonuclease P protein component [Desulfococcaceae bacterium HSG7]|nr:ribonuclease P protein component [Desulfococcaceae bacterium HSG9]MDM8553260.1 ribonuclease P protein component [Desulfococcaceae bacterium HSG7]